MTLPEKERLIEGWEQPYRARMALAAWARDIRLKHIHDPAMDRTRIESDYESSLDAIIAHHGRRVTAHTA
jgi:hypothetical protein